MYSAVTSEQARDIELRAAREGAVDLGDLMRTAGLAVARAVQERVPVGRVVVLAGGGNNGGDGWEAARELHGWGRPVTVLSLRDPADLGGIACGAARTAIDSGVSWEHVVTPRTGMLADTTVVVDAILGTGARLPLRDPLPAWAEAVHASGAYVVAVDLPTGVDADGAGCDAGSMRADCTVTFTTLKRGLVSYPGAACAGEVVVADIGIPERFAEIAGACEVWEAAEYAELLPMPAIGAHKNSRGRVLVIAGSGHFPGAAVLAARGAMRMGAGYVTLAVPEPVVATAQAHLLAAPVVGLPATGKTFSSAAAAVARDLAADYDAVVLGPGLTVADGAAATTRTLVAALEKPLVLDADGLNAFLDHAGLIEARRAPLVLTPHPGELARLMGCSAAEVQSDRISSSARFAGPSRAVVLKGAGTVVTGEGRQVINTSGTPALATAGTGDVLAGMIGALLAQGLSPLRAGALGAYLHGRAGEAAAEALTPVCVTAEDLPEYIPAAVADLLGYW